MASQYFGKSDRSSSDLVLALGLAERIRDLVTKSAPGLVPPRKQVGAVRVMTWHASKGLKFPCVAVVPR
jgi:ATP-dependent exoDNAse (exonuclease V) beta subunit